MASISERKSRDRSRAANKSQSTPVVFIRALALAEQLGPVGRLLRGRRATRR